MFATRASKVLQIKFTTQNLPRFSTATAKAFETIPGPIGTNEFFEKGGFAQIDKVVKHFKDKYGDVVSLDFFGQKMVYLFHPDHIQKAFNNEGKYPRGFVQLMWYYSDFSKSYFGKWHDISGGEEWRTWRSTIQKDIFSPKDAALYLPLIEKCVDEATDAFPSWVNGENHNLFYSAASFDLLQHVLFNKGSDFWTTDFDKNPMKPVLFSALSAFSLMEVLAAYTRESAPKEKVESFNRDMTVTLDFLTERVNQILSSGFDTENTAFRSYFQKLIERGEFDKNKYVQTGSGLLFAAVDTTAATMKWFLCNLAKTPRVQQKLYEEVKEVMGDGPMKMEHLSKIPYLKACFKETFRLTPTISSVRRILPEDLEVGGYNVPAGTLLNISTAFTYSVDKNVYESPEEFRPERWSKDNKSTNNSLHDHPYMILQFSTGPRMCLGARVAEIEIMAVIARMVQKYNISLPENTQVNRLFSATARPNPMPKFIVTKR